MWRARPSRPSLRSRVLVLLLFFLAQAAVSAVSVSSLARRHGEASALFRDALRTYDVTHALDGHIHAAAMAGNDRLIAGAPPQQAERFREADEAVRSRLRTLTHHRLDAKDRQALERVEALYGEMAGIAGEIFAMPRPLGNPAGGALMERMDRTVDEAAGLLDGLLSSTERRIEEANALTARSAGRLRTAALAGLASTALFAVLALALLHVWVLRPLREMDAAIAGMRLGSFENGTSARTRPRNELEEVSARLRSKFVEIARLAELTRAINEGLSLDDVLELVYEKFTGLMPYDRIGLALVEERGRSITARWSKTNAAAKMLPDGFSAPLESTTLSRVLAEGRPRILNDLPAYLAAKPSSRSTALIVSEGMRSSLTCPLVLHGVPVGVMFFSSRERDAYLGAHVDLFLQISGQLAAIVEKSRLHDELVRLNRLKNDFLGMAAHDLRNPAAAIAGYAEILLHDAGGSLAPGDERMLQRIEALGREINALLESLLDVAVIEAGSFTISPAPVALGPFLDEVLESNRFVAESKGTSLALDEARGEVVPFDRLRVSQALGNLIGNAVKYSPPGGRVQVGAAVVDGRVVFHVTDEGPGIPEEEQARLFQPYATTSVRPTGGERSTGLGLAICRKIVEAHGGSIGVESRPGHGSTFRFSIPCAAAAPPPQITVSMRARSAGGSSPMR